MFDNLAITKGFKLEDNITGNNIEVATFNANLVKGSNINIYMNINYPNLYEKYKDDILVAYRNFNAEVSALAITMGLATEIGDSSKIAELSEIRDEIALMTKEVMEQVIGSLGSIQVNPVPIVDVNSNYYR